MNQPVYKYDFDASVAIEDIEATLVLTIMAIENLRGPSQVRLDVSHLLDRTSHRCVIDGATDVGQDLNKLFVGYLDREIGRDAYHVERIDRANTVMEEITT